MYDENVFHSKTIRLILNDHTSLYTVILDGWQFLWLFYRLTGTRVGYWTAVNEVYIR